MGMYSSASVVPVSEAGASVRRQFRAHFLVDLLLDVVGHISAGEVFDEDAKHANPARPMATPTSDNALPTCCVVLHERPDPSVRKVLALVAEGSTKQNSSSGSGEGPSSMARAFTPGAGRVDDEKNDGHRYAAHAHDFLSSASKRSWRVSAACLSIRLTSEHAVINTAIKMVCAL
jgi:hypothetical protein